MEIFLSIVITCSVEPPDSRHQKTTGCITVTRSFFNIHFGPFGNITNNTLNTSNLNIFLTFASSKAPIALDTLPLLEHASANNTTREAENPKCYCSRRVIILYSPPTVGAVVPEIWLWTYASQDRAYPTRFSYSSLYFALHLWHHPYITSVGSLACKIEMMIYHYDDDGMMIYHDEDDDTL